MDKPDYVVMNENTLGYINVGVQDGHMGVLHGKPTRGGHDERNGPVSTFGQTLRPATLEDFNDYKVSSVGHITPLR